MIFNVVLTSVHKVLVHLKKKNEERWPDKLDAAVCWCITILNLLIANPRNPK